MRVCGDPALSKFSKFGSVLETVSLSLRGLGLIKPCPAGCLGIFLTREDSSGKDDIGTERGKSKGTRQLGDEIQRAKSCRQSSCTFSGRRWYLLSMLKENEGTTLL